MLPYITKAKEDKMGVVMFDDVFHDSVIDGEIDVCLVLFIVVIINMCCS